MNDNEYAEMVRNWVKKQQKKLEWKKWWNK